MQDNPHVRIGPVTVVVESEWPEPAVDFAHLYADWRQTGPPADDAIRISIRRSGRTACGAPLYEVSGDGDELFTTLRREEVLPYLEWGINYRVIARCSRFLQLHAATLSRDGQGVVLVGESGSGKSTLTAVLAARGWRYMSDEFALIDPDTRMLHAFPKALCIKAGSFDIVRRLGLPLWQRRPYVKAFKGRVGYVPPAALDVEPGPVPIRLIAFPRYTGRPQSASQPVPRSQAAFSLAANAFNRQVDGGRLVCLLGEIVTNARCVALETGPPDQGADLLANLFPS